MMSSFSMLAYAPAAVQNANDAVARLVHAKTHAFPMVSEFIGLPGNRVSAVGIET